MEKVRRERKYYRLRYPHAERPVLVIAEQQVAVLELSEEGVKLSRTDTELRTGESVDGHIRFRDGTEIPVGGTVLRTDTALVLHLYDGISYRLMLAEQRRLLRQYPQLGGSGS